MDPKEISNSVIKEIKNNIVYKTHLGIISKGKQLSVLSFSRCAVVSTIPAGASYSYTCRGMEGRYVSVNIPGTSKILILCEVGVYVTFPGNSLFKNLVVCTFKLFSFH